MLLNQLYKALIVGVAIVAVSGCTSMGKKAGDAANDAASAKGMTSGGLNGSNLIDDQLRAKSVFYFELDRTDVNPADQAALAAHARFLAANHGKHASLVGHADERGTREYNMALGEHRAMAVAEVLTMNGVSKSQIEIVSYGEEKPAAMGHDEPSWAQNRRVELDCK